MKGSSGSWALLSQSYSSSSGCYYNCKASLPKDFTLHHRPHQYLSASSSFSSSSCWWSCRRKCQFLSLSPGLRLTPFTNNICALTLKNKKKAHIPKAVASASASASAFMVDNSNSTTQQQQQQQQHTAPTRDKDKDKDLLSIMPKIDKSGRFCSPRAARELSLLIIYAACLEGSDPVRLFEKRMNVRREPGYQFDKDSLLEYNHMSFGGPPVITETAEEADELLHGDEKESAIEAEVLSAPPKLVYSKLLLRFTRKLLVAVVDNWDSHVLILDKIAPPNWKNEPIGRILELCILHLAMSEIAALGTRHQIVINEAVDLAKRFCDGSAPRVINGCLRTFVKGLLGTSNGMSEASNANQRVEV